MEGDPKQPYLSQENGTCCFVYAAANLLIHDGIRWPRNPVAFKRLCQIALCEGGAIIHSEKVLRACNLDLEKTKEHVAVFRRGGILTIMHPIFNLHCIAVIPSDVDKWQVLVINSWLGPTIITAGWEELAQFIPENRIHRKHWARKNDG